MRRLGAERVPLPDNLSFVAGLWVGVLAWGISVRFRAKVVSSFSLGDDDRI